MAESDAEVARSTGGVNATLEVGDGLGHDTCMTIVSEDVRQLPNTCVESSEGEVEIGVDRPREERDVEPAVEAGVVGGGTAAGPLIDPRGDAPVGSELASSEWTISVDSEENSEIGTGDEARIFAEVCAAGAVVQVPVGPLPSSRSLIGPHDGAPVDSE